MRFTIGCVECKYSVEYTDGDIDPAEWMKNHKKLYHTCNRTIYYANEPIKCIGEKYHELPHTSTIEVVHTKQKTLSVENTKATVTWSDK